MRSGFRSASAWFVAAILVVPATVSVAAEPDSVGGARQTTPSSPPPPDVTKPSSSVPSTRPTPAQAQQIATTLHNGIKKCWDIPAIVSSVQSKDGKRPFVILRIELDRKGKIVGTPSVQDFGGPEKIRDVLAKSAMNAVRKCAPFSVAQIFPEYYESWKSFRIRFDTAQ